MANTPEGKVKDGIKKFLNTTGCYYEMPVPGGYGKSGLDFHGCFRGRYFAIEAKAKGKKPTPRQRLCMHEIEKAGGGAFVIDDPDGSGMAALKVWMATIIIADKSDG